MRRAFKSPRHDVAMYNPYFVRSESIHTDSAKTRRRSRQRERADKVFVQTAQNCEDEYV